MNIVNFLDPIIWNPATREFGTHTAVESHGQTAEAHTEPATAAEESPAPYGEAHTGFNLAHAVESSVHSETLTEWVFIIISLVVAAIGIGLGLLFYVKDTRLPDIWAVHKNGDLFMIPGVAGGGFGEPQNIANRGAWAGVTALG